MSLQNFNILMGAVPLTQHTVADSVTMPVQLPMYAGVQEGAEPPSRLPVGRPPGRIQPVRRQTRLSEVQPAALGGCAGGFGATTLPTSAEPISTDWLSCG
ncbi:MAG: hypothetical protein ACLR8Y_01700 [Alistipes indistinctus]